MLPKGRTALSADTRTIRAIYYEGRGGFEVGDGQITHIEAYDENGEMGFVPYLAVFNGPKIAARVPARLVSVHYEIP